MGKLVFITGGARSGKTSHALKRVMEHEAPRLYIATAEALDDEMRARIEAHKKEREGNGFDTIESPVEVAQALKGTSREYGAVLMDCLTLWLSNLMGRAGEAQGELDIDKEARGLLEALRRTGSDVYVVSNEVGMGIVPDNALARAFRDKAGKLNRLMASEADEAWMLVSGLPLRLK